MPEALGRKSFSASPNFEIKRRDEREEAAKVSKRLSENRTKEDNSERIRQNSERRESIRLAAETEKKDTTKTKEDRTAQDTIAKRSGQEKSNPDAGNIINVVA